MCVCVGEYVTEIYGGMERESREIYRETELVIKIIIYDIFVYNPYIYVCSCI